MGGDPSEGACAPVLIVRTRDYDADALRDMLARTAYPTLLANDPAEALRCIERSRIGVVLVGGEPEGCSGLALVARIHQAQAETPVLLVEHVDSSWLVRGVYTQIAIPWRVGAERPALEGALRALLEDGERTPRPGPALGARAPAFTPLIGSSLAMENLRLAIDRAASSTASVLIHGESGVGKELVAHAIHANSARRARPFVAVNVSAIPDTLLENEMFGHVRGAFSGATQPRRGLLATADGGSILLDEIGDMPLGLQAKLLRVLQFGELRPVGSDTSRSIDVRVLAATHRDLAEEITAGRFREDLFYRLEVLPIHVPPLRERSEDIPELVEFFFAEALARTPASRVRAISPEATALLRTYAWPGNVRQLAHLVERLVVFGPTEQVEPEHVMCWSRRTSTSKAPELGARFELTTLQRLNERYVSWVLAQTDDNKRRAAEILGIDLSTLYRWRNAKRESNT